jgi:VWFA-related protein
MRIKTPYQLVLAALVALSVIAPMHAQEVQTQPYTLSVRSKLVVVPVVVRDKKGELMQSMTKDDFTLSEDGHPQAIQYFELAKDRPLTLGLMVDMSGSVRNFVTQEHAASTAFFREMLQKDEDNAFLVRFDDAVTILQSPTASQYALRSGVSRLEEWHKSQPVFVRSKDAPIGTTLLYDAIYGVCANVTSQMSGQKALVLLTDGEDEGSQATLAAAVQAAQEANTIIYTILYTSSSSSKGATVLKVLSSATGGHAYEVSKSLPLETIYAKIAEEMRTQYLISYSPQRVHPKPGYRVIGVKIKAKGMNVQTRLGYYAAK